MTAALLERAMRAFEEQQKSGSGGGAAVPPELSEPPLQPPAAVASGYEGLDDLERTYRLLEAGGHGGHGAGRRHIDEEASLAPQAAKAQVPASTGRPAPAVPWPGALATPHAAPAWAEGRSLAYCLLRGALGEEVAREELDKAPEHDARRCLDSFIARLRDGLCRDLDAVADVWRADTVAGRRRVRGNGRAAVVAALASPAAFEDAHVHDAALLHAARALRLVVAIGPPWRVLPEDPAAVGGEARAIALERAEPGVFALRGGGSATADSVRSALRLLLPLPQARPGGKETPPV